MFDNKNVLLCIIALLLISKISAETKENFISLAKHAKNLEKWKEMSRFMHAAIDLNNDEVPPTEECELYELSLRKYQENGYEQWKQLNSQVDGKKVKDQRFVIEDELELDMRAFHKYHIVHIQELENRSDKLDWKTWYRFAKLRYDFYRWRHDYDSTFETGLKTDPVTGKKLKVSAEEELETIQIDQKSLNESQFKNKWVALHLILEHADFQENVNHDQEKACEVLKEGKSYRMLGSVMGRFKGTYDLFQKVKSQYNKNCQN